MKGIIFDLDGVLVHTDEFHYQAWKKLADSLQIPFDRKFNEQLKGVSRIDSLNKILSQTNQVFSETEKDVLANEKNEMYKNLLNNLTPEDVMDDVRNTLVKLHEKGIKLAVGSSSKNAAFILQQVKLDSYFDAISDGTNITKSKPDPEVFLLASEYLFLDPKDCLVVEDADSGIEAAKRGGFTAVGIEGAKNNPKTDYGINKLSDLLELV